MDENKEELPPIFNSKNNFAKMLERSQTEDDSTLTQLFQNNQSQASIVKGDEKIDKVQEKIDRLEGLIHSIIINQNNAQGKLPPPEIKESNLDKKLLWGVLGTVLITSMLTIYLVSRNRSEKIPTPIQSPKLKLVERFVTTKFVNMRESASTKAKIMTVIAPNSIIEIVERKKDWKLIKFKNYVSGSELVGWVYGQNLKKI